MTTYTTQRLPDRNIRLENGTEYLWFSGTDYLGMAHDEKFRRLFLDGISVLGTHFGSSRNNSLQLSIYKEAEEELARYVGSPATLTVSSGMWAGQLLMKEIESIIQISNTTDSAINYHYAPGVHPAIRGNSYISSEQSWSEWAYLTIDNIHASSKHSAHVICTDSVGSPWVQNFDLSIFTNIIHPNTWIIVDDSHGLGVTGASGGGVYQQLSHLKHVIVCASLNKGMGIPAGAIMAAPSVVNLLKAAPGYSGASPCPPAYLYVLKNLLQEQHYQRCYTHLKENIEYFQTKMSGNHTYTSLQHYPVLCSKNPLLFDYLLSNGIMASHFPYPSPTDKPVTRLAITALHTKKDLDRLAEVSILFQKNQD